MSKKPLSARRITAAHAFLLGAALALLALLPAILPYGGRFVTRGDYIEQQLPLILETKRILTQGKSFSLNTFLGTPSVGSYAFYTLGSPFVWPLALLPDALIPFGISVMAILKHAAGTAIAFCYFRRMLRRDHLALLGGVLYMFSSFTVVNTQFYHFLEVIAFFPLILIGLEDAMSERPHPGLLALSCGINAITNYYFMLSSALLAALYFIFRFFSAGWKAHRSLARVVRVVFECGAGCALSGVLLLPAMHFMLGISRGGADLSLTQAYALPVVLERIRSLFMPIESGVVHAYYGPADSWCSVAAYLPVFGMTGTLVFLAGKAQRWLKALLALLFACSLIPALCGVFSLFTNVSYTRWWYGLALMMTLATLYALRDAPLTARPWKIALAVCCAASLALTLPGLLPANQTGAFAGVPFIVLSVVLTLLGAGVMCLLVCRSLRFGAMLALTCAVACAQYAGFIAVNDAHLLSGGSEAGSGIYTLDQIAKPLLGALETEPEQEAFFRIDYSKKLRNYGLTRGQSSLTAFISLRSSTVGRFTQMAGFGTPESPTVAPPQDDPALRALLSVREYHQLEGEAVPEGFAYIREENGFPVYQNENYIPMGFLQTTFTGTHDQPMNPQDVAPVMLAAATLEPDAVLQLEGRMQRLDVTAIPDWQQSVRRLQENACDRFTALPDGFSAHIDAKEAGLLVFTVPYDKGFVAQVDGQPQEIIPCDVAFMGVWVEPGEHEIVFTYRTRSLMPGAAMSALAAAVLAAYMLLCRRRSPAAKSSPSA